MEITFIYMLSLNILLAPFNKSRNIIVWYLIILYKIAVNGILKVIGMWPILKFFNTYMIRL